MKSIEEKEILKQAVTRLGGWLELSDDEIQAQPIFQHQMFGGFFEIGGRRFILEAKAYSSTAHISSAVQALKNNKYVQDDSPLRLVVVPFMGEVGRKICREAGVSWLDLSGNADISGQGLRILIDGRPNRFKKTGRPSNPFAPKSSRIARWLLMHPERSMNQREIALSTGMDEGLTSRVVSRLERDGLVVRSQKGLIKVPDPDILLEAWQERYDFNRHEILRGTIAARSSEALLKRLPALFAEHEVPYAVTGLGAAWLYTKFSGFRIVTLYLESKMGSEGLDLLGFREEPRGANLWLVFPNDEGVFQGTKDAEGIRAAHPVQVYLDLSAHPERAKEAAGQLRKDLLKWGRNA